MPNEALEREVRGQNLRMGTFADQLGDRTTVTVFLRHLGCMFCRETVAELRKVHEASRERPPVLFVHQGTAEQGRAFFDKRWPEARAIADPDAELYRAFGLERGCITQVLGPKVWPRALKAMMKHGLGPVVGDPFMMPGIFIVRGSTILWRHDHEHSGDTPCLHTVYSRALAAAL